jgi:Cu/Zn superoxide dismutase
MSKISRRGLRITAAAAGAGVIAAAALAATAHAGPADAATSTPQQAALVTRVQLAPMPQGTVTFGRNGRGEVDVTVNASGLTPGSSHKVELADEHGRVITTFRPLTANSVGRARDETLDSGYLGALGAWRVVIRNGTKGNPVSDERIARTSNYTGGLHTYQLIAVEAGPDGKSYGIPRGSAVIAVNRDAQTISVTVNASGFTPGAHAAHIHVGSCLSQGPVQYMLMDFTANADGRIVDQTRVIRHVTTLLPSRGWYFNLHQGNMRNILANGRPTINFRPLLCGDIVPQG